MIWGTMQIETVRWQSRYALFPTLLKLDDGGWINVWLERYDWRDIDGAVEEIRLKDGRMAKRFHGS